MENQPKINLKETSEVSCNKCKCESFVDGYMLRKVSALLTGKGKEAYLPIPLWVCAQCGSVNSEFMPPELRSPIIS